jgi:hypothetical protein
MSSHGCCVIAKPDDVWGRSNRAVVRLFADCIVIVTIACRNPSEVRVLAGQPDHDSECSARTPLEMFCTDDPSPQSTVYEPAMVKAM